MAKNRIEISFSDPQLWDVYIYDEMNILSNALKALASYRQKCGEYWPAKIIAHSQNRINIGFGQDVEFKREDWTLKDALYLSFFKPYKDLHNDERESTVFDSKREPILSTKQYRKRSLENEG